jgi:dihydrofolate synthase/folylpolyglutamate synthase
VGDVLTGSRRSYRDALDYLFARTTGKFKFGLERTTALLRLLGDPHRRLRVLHVAGTNGKGSVCATLDAVLRARGLRVGRYTSPHLVDFRERFLVDGVPVDADFVTGFVDRWVDDVERIGASFFEATTALAFDWFVRQGVDAAVVEAGLGGRLDSTNVVEPLAAIVTSIGLDHVEYLGDTRELIAMEKAGIFKQGALAALGEPDEAIAAILASAASERGASRVLDVWRESPPRDVVVDASGTSFRIEHEGATHPLRTPLPGAHQASNAALAVRVLAAVDGPLRVPIDEAARALDRVRLPGRFQRVGPFVFDVAHNVDGADVLARTVEAVRPPGPIVALLSVLGDKDWRGIMRSLARVVDAFVLTTAPTSPASRAWDVSEAAAFARDMGWRAVTEGDFERSIDAARAEGATVLVTGSFHTVGDAMARLQVDPLAG